MFDHDSGATVRLAATIARSRHEADGGTMLDGIHPDTIMGMALAAKREVDGLRSELAEARAERDAAMTEAEIAKLRNPPAVELEETLEVPVWVAESIERARGTSSRAADARPGLYFDSVVIWLAEDREKLLATVKRFISSERVMAARYHDAQADNARLREAMQLGQESPRPPIDFDEPDDAARGGSDE